MAASGSGFLTQLLQWLRPDAALRRYGLAVLFVLAPWLFIAVTGTTRWAHCRHYPDITSTNGVHTYTCLDPQWKLACANRIKNDTVDTCLRHPFSWGVTLIRHDKDLLLQDCKQAMGPEAYLDGSNGCVCFLPLDQHGRCTTSTEHCRTRFGAGAIADVTSSRSGTLLVLASNERLQRHGNFDLDEERYLICRCGDGLTFDQTSQTCQ